MAGMQDQIWNQPLGSALIVVLVLIIFELVKHQVIKRGNGTYTQEDRENATKRDKNIEALAGRTGGLAGDCQKYFEAGYSAMAAVRSVEKVVEESAKRQYDQGERISAMAAASHLASTNNMNLLVGLQTTMTEAVRLLGEIRDLAKAQEMRSRLSGEQR